MTLFLPLFPKLINWWLEFNCIKIRNVDLLYMIDKISTFS